MAAPNLQAIGAFQETDTGASITIAWPAHQAGDIGILYLQAQGESISLSTANGFVEMPGSPMQDGSSGGVSSTSHAVYWCRATSGAMASPVSPRSGVLIRGVIITFRGCIASGNPWNATASNIAGAQTGTVNLPGLTTTTDNCLVVQSCTNSTDSITSQMGSVTNSSLANLTKALDSNSGVGAGAGLTIVTGTKGVPGTVGTTTSTLSTVSRQCHHTIALRPNDVFTADKGTFTVTGNNAILARSLKLPAAAGVFTLTGQAVGSTITHRYVLNADSGSFVFSGGDVALRKKFGNWEKSIPVMNDVWTKKASLTP